VAGEHQTALESYLASVGDSAKSRADPAIAGAALPGRQGEAGISAGLAEAYGLLNEAVFRYGVLTTALA